MQKQRLILIAGAVLALIAVLLVKVYLDQERKSFEDAEKKKAAALKESQISVLVAKKDIPRGIAVDSDSLDVKIIPKQYIEPQAVTSLDRIGGMVTTAAITKGEQITLGKLTYPRSSSSGGSLAEVTPVGKRAITISVDNISALLGMIKPGDYVDVIAVLPIPVQTAEGKQSVQPAVVPLFQNILVVAVGQQTGGSISKGAESRYRPTEEKKDSAPLITLALGPQEASLIAFVQEQGKIRLVLRSPADSKLEQVQPTSWDTVFQYIMPNMPPAKDKAKEENKNKIPEGDYVEIDRGPNKEKVLLSK